MIRLKSIKGFDDRRFWQDQQSKSEYGRVVGGLAWSHEDLPGWLVVLGEERHPREDARKHINVISAWVGRHEQRILPPREIMDEARAQCSALHFPFWVSPDDHPDVALLSRYNRALGKHDRRLRLCTPPQYERAKAFQIYDRLLDSRTQSGFGLPHTFHVGGHEQLQQEFAVLRPTDRLRPLDEFPAVAATLYALAWLEFVSGEYGQAGTRNEQYKAPRAGY